MGRAPCCDKVGLKKGPWTPDEDQKLVAYIQQHGHGSWRALPKLAGLLRCGKSCRLRWTNYLRPDIKRGRFAADEEQMIIQLHAILGNRWSAIATYLPGRTDNEIKNYWNTHLKKRLMHMGIDPVTHKPKTDHVLEFPNAKPQLASELSHMAQWQSARLEAEARLAKQRHMQQQSSCIGNASSTAHVNILPPSFSSSSSVLTAHTANSAAFARHSIQSASSTSVTNENLAFRSAPTPGSLDFYSQALNSRRDFDSHAAQYYSNCSSSPFPPPPVIPSCSQLSSADPDVPFCAFSSVYSNRIPQLELEESDNFLQSCALAENSCSMSPAIPLYHSLTGLLCPQELHVRSNANFLNLPNVSAFNAPTISSPFDYTNSTLMTDGGGSLYSSSSWGSMQQFQYSDHEHAGEYSSTPSVSMGGGGCISCTPGAGGESYNGPLEGLSKCNGVRQQTLSSPGSDLIEEEDTNEDQQVPQENLEGKAVAQHLCPAASGEDRGDIQVKEEDGDEVEQAEAERGEQDKQEGEEESSASEHHCCNDDAAEPWGAIVSRPSVSIKEEEGKGEGASSAESSACTATPRPPVSGSTHAVAAHNPFLEFLDFNQVPMLINWPACTGADNVGADYWSSFLMQQHTLHLKPTAGPPPPPLADPTSPRVSQT